MFRINVYNLEWKKQWSYPTFDFFIDIKFALIKESVFSQWNLFDK